VDGVGTTVGGEIVDEESPIVDEGFASIGVVRLCSPSPSRWNRWMFRASSEASLTLLCLGVDPLWTTCKRHVHNDIAHPPWTTCKRHVHNGIAPSTVHPAPSYPITNPRTYIPAQNGMSLLVAFPWPYPCDVERTPPDWDVRHQPRAILEGEGIPAPRIVRNRS
jgi:hypothetical protein